MPFLVCWRIQSNINPWAYCIELIWVGWYSVFRLAGRRLGSERKEARIGLGGNVSNAHCTIQHTQIIRIASDYCNLESMLLLRNGRDSVSVSIFFRLFFLFSVVFFLLAFLVLFHKRADGSNDIQSTSRIWNMQSANKYKNITTTATEKKTEKNVKMWIRIANLANELIPIDSK